MNNFCCEQVKQAKKIPKVKGKRNLSNISQWYMHKKDAKSQVTILACKHFNEENHNFQQHAEFTLIEQFKKQTTTEEKGTLLKRRENFWVLHPVGLDQELNNID